MTYDKFKFTQAARSGNIDYITEFLNSADAETKKEALAEAVECNDSAIVKKLLEGGADPNCKDKFRRPVLLKAVLGKHIDLVKTLIEAGADVNCQDAFKRPVLFAAIESSDVESVKELLSSPKINKNYKDVWGRTALAVALSANVPSKIIELLSDKTEAGEAKKIQMPKQSKEDFIKKAKSGDFQYIKEHFGDVSLEARKSAFVHTPSVEIAERLLSSGVWVDAQDAGSRAQSVWRETWSYTALGEACKNNNTEKALWLIAAGADVNIPHIHTELVAGMANIDDEDNFSPLMFAVENNNAYLAARLIEAGADINYKGHRGAKNVFHDKPETAMDIALRVGNEEIIDLLSRAGAPQKEKPVIDEAFFNAAVQGNIDYVKANCHKTSEQTLNAALVYASDIKILDLLFFAGANLNAEYALGNSVKFDDGEYYSCWTPLLQACAAGNYQKAAWLLQRTADPNIPIIYRNENGAKYKQGGESALMFAASLCSMEMVKLLLEAGADPNYKNFQGVDTCSWALKAEDGFPETPIYNLIKEYAERRS
ncbi:MAG: ankyrin repeat domain-containing protein [Elusimicrobia bacterium]|nr:ankyrin repeat domain-containing protein [Elusimicrobiota bacterium]